MTPSDTARMLSLEMLEDLEDICRRLEQFGSRWSQYGEQFQKELTVEARKNMEERMDELLARLSAAGID